MSIITNGRNNEEGRVPWIKGDPGKGKKMLLCGIIDETSASTRVEDKGATTLPSLFFCQATDSRINNATAVLRGLMYLLINQKQSLLSHVRKSYDDTGNALFEDANAWFELCRIFKAILQDPDLGSTYLIIDALCTATLPKLLNFIDEAALLIQLRTGMARLNGYLHGISTTDSDLCQCGTAGETVKQYLFRCPRWDNLQQDLLSQTKDMRGNLSFYLGGKTRHDPAD